MEQEEISDPTIAVGDRVWWGIFRGTVRAIGFEEPNFSYAVIATDPDGRILQAPLHWLGKGMPPDPTPISQESPEEELQPRNDDDSGLDMDMYVWGETIDGSQVEETE